MRLGSPLKNQMCETGQASSICPMRSRRTLAWVTSTPHFSQTTPRWRMRLYLPHRHSQSLTGPKILAQNRPSRSRFEGAVIDGLRFFDLAVGPFADLVRSRDGNPNGLKIGVAA